jgi:hypothetical protein
MRLSYYKYSFRKGTQKIKTRTAVTLSAFGVGASSLIGALAISLAPAAAVTTTTIYNNIPNPTPGNVSSEAFEAQTVSEFGGQVAFAGTERNNPTVTVLMSSWGCQTGHWFSGDCVTATNATFAEDVTLNVYNVSSGNAVGSLVTSKTSTFQIPYRPSANSVCGDGRWSKDGTNATCFNGFATPISFTLTGTTLPNTAIISVAYNTTHFGYQPIGEGAACFSTGAGCGYDSLNVGLNTVGAPSVGTDPAPSDAYLFAHLVQGPNSNAGYCSTGAVDTFRLDTGCWGGFQPAFKVDASTAAALPTSKDQCMKDGWKNYGTTFKNQGDCVSFVATKGKNQPAGN